jgi:hypothetical protein
MSTINATTLRATTIQHTNGTNALTVDTAGRVNFGNKPLVHVCRNLTGAWENFGNTPVIYIYNAAITNVGSHYNTSTGFFTCPVAGYYRMTTAALFGSQNSNAYQYHYKNSAGISGNISAHCNGGGGAYWTTGYTTIVQCAVNDTLAVYAASGSSMIYGSGHSNLTIEFLG